MGGSGLPSKADHRSNGAENTKQITRRTLSPDQIRRKQSMTAAIGDKQRKNECVLWSSNC
jgi:hypothetical protein